MPHRPPEDWEDPEPDDDEGEESDEYVCPNCGESVYEDCEQCPHCGDYITPRSPATSAFGGRWLVFGVALMIVATVLLAIFAR